MPPATDLDLRTEFRDAPLTPDMKRFDVFLIDTGWNAPISRKVREQLPLIHEYQSQDSLYLLTVDQSVRILKHAPEAIGHDPIILVYDQYATHRDHHSRYRGFRLSLGLFRQPEQAMARLQEFLRFVATHRTAARLDREIRRELHREGFDGMVRVLREASVELA